MEEESLGEDIKCCPLEETPSPAKLPVKEAFFSHLWECRAWGGQAWGRNPELENLTICEVSFISPETLRKEAEMGWHAKSGTRGALDCGNPSSCLRQEMKKHYWLKKNPLTVGPPVLQSDVLALPPLTLRPCPSLSHALHAIFFLLVQEAPGFLWSRICATEEVPSSAWELWRKIFAFLCLRTDMMLPCSRSDQPFPAPFHSSRWAACTSKRVLVWYLSPSWWNQFPPQARDSFRDPSSKPNHRLQR